MADPTQEALLEAAFEAVVAHGYAGATTRRIAQIAGVNEVTLFRKFGNKANLLKEVIRREAEAVLEHSVHYTGDLEADGVALVESYQALIRRRGRAIPILLVELPRRPELSDIVHAPLHTVQAILGLLGRYQQEGRLASGPTIHLLLTLVAPVFATELFGLHAPGSVPPLDPRRHVQTWIRANALDRPLAATDGPIAPATPAGQARPTASTAPAGQEAPGNSSRPSGPKSSPPAT